MKKYETKTWKVIQKNLEKEIANREHFGWEFVSNSLNNNGTFVYLVMKRDRSNPNYRRLRSLSFQSRVIGTTFPFSFIIWTIVGLAFLIPWLFLQAYSYMIFLLIIALFCFSIALFILLIFVFTRGKKSSLLGELYCEGDELLGKLKVKPTDNNIMKPGPESFHLRKLIISKNNEKKNN